MRARIAFIYLTLYIFTTIAFFKIIISQAFYEILSDRYVTLTTKAVLENIGFVNV
jgi:hypothetical protein